MKVVDASVALKWFLIEPGDAEAVRLANKGNLIAPELLLAEVCNAVWKAVRQGRLSEFQATHIAQVLPTYFDALIPLRQLAERATEIALALNHPVYDCFYVALAEQAASKLVTADRRLLERTQGTPWAPLLQNLYAGTSQLWPPPA